MAEAIRAGELRPGDKLPSEPSLATRFGVARSVLREAISQLRYDGLIEARQGVGAFIADPRSRSAFRIGPACFKKRQELLKLLQLRSGVSVEAATLAATARRPEHLAALEDCLDAMRAAIVRGMEGAAARVDAELRFYSTVAAASGNEYLEEFLSVLENRILSELHSVAVKNAMASEWSERVVGEHKAVLVSIRDMDPEAAHDAARRHFERAAKRLADRTDIADV